MKYAILSLVFFIACSEPPSSDPINDPSPYAELYSIITVPDWQAVKLTETYEAKRAGSGYTLTPDSLIFESDPDRFAWPVDTRVQGNELWFRGGPWSFRGYLSSTIPGKFVEKKNGRYGPILSATFQRVQ